MITDIMKILFFSYLSYDNDKYKGGGWINSLSTVLSELPQYEVAVAYLSTKKTCKFKKDNITYYPIFHKVSFLNFLHRHVLKKVEQIRKDSIVDSIILDFCPDIIQLFGLETSFGSILVNVKNVPVVVHIQGICTAIIDKYFPIGMSPKMIWWHSSIRDKLFFVTANDLFVKYKQRAKVERFNYRNYKYYLGRTEWDFSVSRLLSPSSHYYKSDEMLRSDFYEKKWNYKERDRVVLSTTMNGDIYKGLDTILKTAKLLNHSNLNFEWNIYGITDEFSLKKVFERILHLNYAENNVYFRGKKNANELVQYLLDSTFYVHPSHIDNSPNALCEAMMVGVPCIASYVGGIPTLLTDKKNGFLVPDADSYELAYVIVSNYNNREFLNYISANAQSDARHRHNREQIISQLTGAYQAIIDDFANK